MELEFISEVSQESIIRLLLDPTPKSSDTFYRRLTRSCVLVTSRSSTLRTLDQILARSKWSSMCCI